ncbi:MAG: Gfo/Idh/MocA family oxidoreductase, partial [Candidatus Nanopelagicales bacterium]
MTQPTRMRMGLVGTGYWASQTHALGIVNAPDAELAAVWGRDPSATNELAARHAAKAFADFDDFLSDIDAVSFSVPPHVQAPLAVRAAVAGKHLLLEKPIALDERAADEMVAAVQSSGVAALVFFTHLFAPPSTQWFRDLDDSKWL